MNNINPFNGECFNFLIMSQLLCQKNHHGILFSQQKTFVYIWNWKKHQCSNVWTTCYNVPCQHQNAWRVRHALSYQSNNKSDLPTLPFMTFTFSSTAKRFIRLVLTVWDPITELSMWNTLTIIAGELVCSRTCWYIWKSVNTLCVFW